MGKARIASRSARIRIAVGILATILMTFPAFRRSVYADVLFQDDFESFTLGTYPSSGGWVQYYNGAGDSQQYIDDTHAVSGTKSFRTMGSSCWISLHYVPLTLPARFSLETKVYINEIVGGGCTQYMTHVGLFESGTGNARGRVVFGGDGNIHVEISNESLSPALRAYSAGTWYRLKIDYDLSALLYDVYINGDPVALAVPLGSGLTPDSFLLGAGHGTGPVAWFDDVSVDSTPCSAAPSDLVSWWKAEDNGQDHMAINEAAAQNGAAYAPGVVGQAFSLDGDDDFMSVVSPVNIPLGAAPRTFTAWINSAGITSGNAYQGIIGYGIPTLNAGTSIYFERGGDDSSPSNNKLFVMDLRTGADGDTSLAFGQWWHVAYTNDGSTAKLYVNGVLDGTESITHSTVMDTTGFMIGNVPWLEGWHRNFRGLIDEPAVFSRALTAEEILSLYNAGSAGMCRPCMAGASGLLSSWSGDGNAVDLIALNNLTSVGSGSFGSGIKNQAFSLAGSGAYLEDSGSAGSFGSNPFTVDFWFNSHTTGSGIYLLGKSHPDGGLGWDVRLDDGRIQVAGVNGWGFNITSAALIEVDTWHHIVLSSDGSTVNLYIDGTSAGSCARSAISSTSNPFRVGFTTNFGGSSFNGLIDEIAISDRVYSETEATVLYRAQSSGRCALDTNPEAFSFSDEIDAAVSTQYQDCVTIAGLSAAAAVSLTGGEYSIGGGSFGTAPGYVLNGQEICVRQTSAAAYSTTTNAILTVDDESDTFSVTTGEEPTPTPTATATETPTATFTPTYTATATATFTVTSTPTPTSTPTYTPTATFTPTYTSTATFTPTSTPTPTVTATATSTSTPTPTSTQTSTPTATPDTTAPLVTARKSSGKSGKKGVFVYKVVEASGVSRERITVKQGRRVLKRFNFAATSIPQNLVKKTTFSAARLSRGTLTFCVTAYDSFANRSRESCARLTIR